MLTHDFQKALHAAGILAGRNQKDGVKDLKTLLRTRLLSFREVFDCESPSTSELEDSDLRQIQYETGICALQVVEYLCKILQTANYSDDKPVLGSRDLSDIRTLLAIIFKWTTEPILDRLVSSWPTKTSKKSRSAHIIDLTIEDGDLVALYSVSKRILALIISTTVTAEPSISTTPITPILINKHLSDILKPVISIGWLPPSLLPDTVASFADIRTSTIRLLQLLPPSLTLSALGNVLPSLHSAHSTKAASFLLSRQVIRADGVKGLFAAVFGESDGELHEEETLSLDKLEHVSRILSTVPADMKPDAYYGLIVPSCIHIITPSVQPDDPNTRPSPPSHIRASAFTLSRLLIAQDINSAAKQVIFLLLHGSLRRSSDILDAPLPALAAFQTLSTLILNTDPSPPLISALLSPIIPMIYSLMIYLLGKWASDPSLVELCNSLFVVWAKITSLEEAREVLWSIIQGEGGSWGISDEGSLQWHNEKYHSLLPEFPSAQSRENDSPSENLISVDSNPFRLYPPPQHFVDVLKSSGRADLASELFIRLLDSYLELRREDADPLRLLLYLQLILQMQTQLTQSDEASNIWAQPQRILSFIYHALDLGEVQSSAPSTRSSSRGMTLESLKIIDIPDDVDLSNEESGDSDDETKDDAIGGSGLPDSLAATALSLLLSILERYPDLSTTNAPILDQIWLKLESFTHQKDLSIRSLAREARLVMAARLASGSTVSEPGSTSSADDKQFRSREKYQKALKLIQDPILPVRAHGLLLLRELVLPRYNSVLSSGNTKASPPDLDEALVPGILSIFLQSLEDEESYIFLHAVQGLSAMVDGFGTTVLKRLVEVYTAGLVGPYEASLSKHDMDIRLRVGEALTQVIRRCGLVLPSYSDLLIPPLLRLVRQRDASILMKVSALSVLAQCAETNTQSLLPYRLEIVQGMNDLLQLESVRAQSSNQVGPGDGDNRASSLNKDPATSNSKVAEFRRAALHLLSMLLKSSADQLSENVEHFQQQHSSFPSIRVSRSGLTSVAARGSQELYPADVLQRTRVTLQYVATTDEDYVVRAMARDAGDILDILAR